MESNKHLRTNRFILLGIVAAFPLIAFAQSTTASPYKYLDMPNGDRIIVPASDTRQAQRGQQIWNSAMSNTVPGSVQIGRNFSMPNPQGVQVPATAYGRLPAPAVAAAVGRVATAALKSLTPIGIGVALYDLAVELGHSARRSPDGTLEITKAVRTPSGSFDSATIANCAAWGGMDGTKPGVACVEADSSAYMGYPSVGLYKSPNFNTPWSARYVESYTNQTTVVPLTQFTDLIAAKSGWPASSKINDVMLKDPNPELQVPQEIIVSGPASSPGPKTTTVNNTKNTTTTNTNTNNYSYAGDTITNNITNTTVTVDNSTGAITNSETTTSTPAPPAPPAPTPERCPPGSTELNCAALDTPEGEIPKVTKDVTYQAESMFSGGACPADVSVPQRATGRPLVLSYTPTCNALATYVKPIIIAIALFMAYLIILPGRTD